MAKFNNRRQIGRRNRHSDAPLRDGLLLWCRSAGQGRAFLYACGFRDGVVKIGMSSMPRERVSQFWRETNGSLSWAHLFGAPMERERALLAEQQAVRSLAGRYERRRFEYFIGVPRDVTLEHCRRAIALADAIMELNP